MGIYQRCLANYEEDAIFENSRVKEICVNCHATNQGNPEEYIFHQDVYKRQVRIHRELSVRMKLLLCGTMMSIRVRNLCWEI